MNNDLISVIIPLYNIAPYLRKCLDSILNQTYQNFEVLMIDDGSTDLTKEICQEYVALDERFSYIYQENKGVSIARNVGIQHSSGKYITFIDGDDWIEKNYLEILYQKSISHHSDVTVVNYFQFREQDTNFIFHIYEEQPDQIFYPNQRFVDYMLSQFNSDVLWGVVWGKLFVRELFDNIQFPGDIRWSEDFATLYRLCLQANKIVYVHQAPYCYRERVDSATNIINEEQVKQTLKVSEERITTLGMLGINPKLDVEHHLGMLQWLHYNMQNGWGLEDTPTFLRINETLRLIESSKVQKQTELALPLISIIVPVYNTELFIEQCVSSICKQTYPNLEVIVVDDGSTDSSILKSKSITKDDKRFIYITKSNGGLSDARNAGIRAASGEFIYFLDADDYLLDKSIENLYHVQKLSDFDIVVGGFSRLGDGVFYQYPQYMNKNVVEVMTNAEAINGMNSMEDYPFLLHSTACGKLFRKSLFESIKFPVGKYAEDQFTTWKLYLEAKSIVFYHRETYIYRIHHNSLSQNYSINHLDFIEALEERMISLKELGYDISLIMPQYLYVLKLNLSMLEANNYDEAEEISKKLKNAEKGVFSFKFKNDK